MSALDVPVRARRAPSASMVGVPGTELVDELRHVGRRAGLDRLGVADARPLDDTRAVLEARKAAGLHGGMQFTYRNPARSTDPARALPGVASIVVGARAYSASVPDPGELVGQGPLARVARYASADSYSALRTGLEAVAGRLRADGWQARVVLDDNALVDRAVAHRAGLGWFGKNANLLLDGDGSWFVLGSVLTDAPLPPAAEPVADGCGSCTRCLDGCPTGAIVAPGVVDGRRCLAWLVQAEGVFPIEHRVALGDRLYGCDTCQEVCPPTRRAGQRRAVPPPPAAGAWVVVLELLDLSDEELLSRFGRWYIPRREPRYLRRNALLVLANTAPVPAGGLVRSALARALGDDDALIRAHAVWSARRLGVDDLLAVLEGEHDALVQAELERPVPRRGGHAAGAVPLPFPTRHPGDR